MIKNVFFFLLYVLLLLGFIGGNFLVQIKRIDNPVDPAGSICSCQRLSHASLSINGFFHKTAEGSLNQL